MKIFKMSAGSDDQSSEKIEKDNANASIAEQEASIAKQDIAEQEADENASKVDQETLTQLASAQFVRIGRTKKGWPVIAVPTPQRTENSVKIHVYDLLNSNHKIFLRPNGLKFPIGDVYRALNSGLHQFGTGIYHCGIEINGIEYAYGRCDHPAESGLYVNLPGKNSNYSYRASVDLGLVKTSRKYWICTPHNEKSVENENEDETNEETKISQDYPTPEEVRQMEQYPFKRKEVNVFVDGSQVLREMASEWRGIEYNLFSKNCCTFVRSACLRLGIEEDKLPSWLTNLSEGCLATGTILGLPLTRAKGLIERMRNMSMLEFTADGFEISAEYEKITSSRLVITDVLEAEKSFHGLAWPIPPMEICVQGNKVIGAKIETSSSVPKPSYIDRKLYVQTSDLSGVAEEDVLSPDDIVTFTWPNVANARTL